MFYKNSKVLIILEVKRNESIIHGWGIDRIGMTIAANKYNKADLKMGGNNHIRGFILEKDVSPSYMGWLESNIKFLHHERLTY